MRLTVWKGQTVLGRIADQVLVGDGCWQWTGRVDAKGYGSFVYLDGKPLRPYVLMYTLLVGPVPTGLTLDHRCHSANPDLCHQENEVCPHRSCVNPGHLEPVTQGENNHRGASPWAKRSRQTHCYRGHEFTDANTYVDRRGCRNCRTCHRENVARHKREKRERMGVLPVTTDYEAFANRPAPVNVSLMVD